MPAPGARISAPPAQLGPPFITMRPTRSGLSRPSSNLARGGLRGFIARWTWPLLFVAVLVTLVTILPGHKRERLRGSSGSGATDSLLESRQKQRQLYGRAERKYVKGVTGVHVAAVSSGDPHPYPGVNNTERWVALADSCPYPFTRLGEHEPWIGDKGVTKNKLMYYMKCACLLFSRHAGCPLACPGCACKLQRSPVPPPLHVDGKVDCSANQHVHAQQALVQCAFEGRCQHSRQQAAMFILQISRSVPLSQALRWICS
mmetsp:Transcript_18874/g.57038  ORF Transcript_18874/g.57038 Transcript_18874/m.57038 type:complete len:259 (+) Transcript_18874:271-1047(+)